MDQTLIKNILDWNEKKMRIDDQYFEKHPEILEAQLKLCQVITNADPRPKNKNVVNT